MTQKNESSISFISLKSTSPRSLIAAGVETPPPRLRRSRSSTLTILWNQMCLNVTKRDELISLSWK